MNRYNLTQWRYKFSLFVKKKPKTNMRYSPRSVLATVARTTKQRRRIILIARKAITVTEYVDTQTDGFCFVYIRQLKFRFTAVTA